MRVTEIDRQIAEESEQLADAKHVTAAAEALSQEPSSPKYRVAVVQAQSVVAEIQVGIDALNASRVEAKKHDDRKLKSPI